MNKPCLDCSKPRPRTRCRDCERYHDRTRRPSPTERYGPGYQRRHREVVEFEPWCHYPAGYRYQITAANPLTVHGSGATSHRWDRPARSARPIHTQALGEPHLERLPPAGYRAHGLAFTMMQV